MYKITKPCNAVVKLTDLRVDYKKVGYSELSDVVTFKPTILSEHNADSTINSAVSGLLTVLSKSKLTLDCTPPHSERIVVKQIISYFKALSTSITLEKKMFKNFRNDDQIKTGHLGIGNDSTTWYGTPHGRIRGHSSSSDVSFVCDENEAYDSESSASSSSGTSSTFEVKKHASQAIGTAVTSSFVENNLHRKLNPLVPCLLLNCYTVQVYMYDCVNDVLIISDKITFRQDDDTIQKSALLFIWVFINHRYVDNLLTI